MGLRRRVKKVRIFRAWFSHGSGAVSALEPLERKPFFLKEQGEPFVFDFKKLLMALSDKEAVAQSEVDAFMENCAKRWQTREGTYQLKRRRLKPDVRDPPEYPGADIDMADI